MSVKEEIALFNQQYPLQTKKMDGVEFTYRYVRNGETTLVLLTGGMGRSDLFYKHFQAFAQRYSVLTFDYPLGYTSNERLALAIAQLIKELGIGLAYLVGQSYGGLLAQVIAKYHSEVVKGMVLSNTGCLAEDMNEQGKKGMQKMLDHLQKSAVLVKFVPIKLLKPKMKKSIMEKAGACSEAENQFMNEAVDEMLETMSARSEEHMCKLMADLDNEWQMVPKDFSIYKGKVLLLFSEDDHTFNEGIRKALIDIMPQPVVRRDISGGHLALLLNSAAYIEAVEEFVG